jgi:hypothetical protein
MGGAHVKDNKNHTDKPTVAFSDSAITKLSNSQVCMVNNRFMNSEQIAVPINEKTYYGCCEGCVKMLKEEPSSRVTYDLLSGEDIDKAIAFIIGKPGTTGDVLYFKSEANAVEYFNKSLRKTSFIKQ